MLHVNISVTFEKGCTCRSSLLQQLLRIIIIIVWVPTSALLSFCHTCTQQKFIEAVSRNTGKPLPHFICFHVQLHDHNILANLTSSTITTSLFFPIIY